MCVCVCVWVCACVHVCVCVCVRVICVWCVYGVCLYKWAVRMRSLQRILSVLPSATETHFWRQMTHAKCHPGRNMAAETRSTARCFRERLVNVYTAKVSVRRNPSIRHLFTQTARDMPNVFKLDSFEKTGLCVCLGWNIRRPQTHAIGRATSSSRQTCSRSPPVWNPINLAWYWQKRLANICARLGRPESSSRCFSRVPWAHTHHIFKWKSLF